MSLQDRLSRVLTTLDGRSKERLSLQKQLELRFPEQAGADSSTSSVGYAGGTGLSSAALAVRARSLRNVFNQDELGSFIAGNNGPQYHISDKMDGVALELVYRGGSLIAATTRGDGQVGEDVLHSAKYVYGIPMEIPDTFFGTLVVKGEVVITKANFKILNEEYGGSYKDPRNAAAGILRRLVPDRKTELLTFFAYNIYTINGQLPTVGSTFSTQADKQQAGIDLGFTWVCSRVVDSLAEAVQYIQQRGELRPQLPYETDGQVVMVNNIDTQESLGHTATSPRFAVAYKFPPKSSVTIVLDIVLQTGRTGQITPVAKLQPVQVGHVTIESATLHNQAEIQRLGVNIGDTVQVERAGDVIPKITKVLARILDEPFDIYELPCPVCGSEHRPKVDGHDETVQSYCTNPTCSSLLYGAILHWGSRDVADIQGLGETTVEKLLERNLVRSVVDLYDLTHTQVESLPGFGKVSARKLVGEIQKSRGLSLARFIYGLGIPEVGNVTAQRLADRCRSIYTLKDLTYSDLVNIRDVGEVTARSVLAYIANNETYIRRLGLKAFPSWKVVEEVVGDLTGQHIAITGTLSKPRKEIEKILIARGATVDSDVKTTTTMLLYGPDSGTKFDKAKRKGILCVTEAELL